jgi:hypothetical protein
LGAAMIASSVIVRGFRRETAHNSLTIIRTGAPSGRAPTKAAQASVTTSTSGSLSSSALVIGPSAAKTASWRLPIRSSTVWLSA